MRKRVKLLYVKEAPVSNECHETLTVVSHADWA
ncbi:MAG: hypothetical protein JWO70_1107, partial [Betaproteobacteria bacterium]|nr:hypothetical protein [Betaproteobacteria bacterium]